MMNDDEVDGEMIDDKCEVYEVEEEEYCDKKVDEPENSEHRVEEFEVNMIEYDETGMESSEAVEERPRMTNDDELDGEMKVEESNKESMSEKWRKIDRLTAILKETEETWNKRNREETSIAKRKEKEERLKRVAAKKKKFGEKLGKETRREKKESEETLRRNLARIEIKKNLWRSYRVEGKLVKLEDRYLTSKKGKEEEEEEDKRKEKERRQIY